VGTPALPVAVALGVIALITNTTSGALTWALAGMGVTLTYFLIAAAQIFVLTGLSERLFRTRFEAEFTTSDMTCRSRRDIQCPNLSTCRIHEIPFPAERTAAHIDQGRFDK
jgi:hypothetical protein